MSRAVTTIVLTADDCAAIGAMLDDVRSRCAGIEDPRFIASSAVRAHELPPVLRRAVDEFRRAEDALGLVIRGFAIADHELGPTPSHWDVPSRDNTANREELYLALVATLLGDLFAWSTLQRGRVIMNVLPVPGEEDSQTGHGTSLLEWHTEDAFHPLRCDYLGLLCLRNPGAVPTMVAGLRAEDLSADDRFVLGQPRFLFRPDSEHVRLESNVAEASALRWSARPTAVLFGSADDPYLRVDPIFMDVAEDDVAGRRALGSLVDALHRNLVGVELDRGDLLILDNYRTVHGRAAFTARHDGSDRWLKKVMVTRDLRKSRTLRRGAGDPIVGCVPTLCDSDVAR